MKELLMSCISRLREMQHSSEMTLADRDQLSKVIARLEKLDRELADERDEAKRLDRIFLCVEHVSRILARIFFDRV